MKGRPAEFGFQPLPNSYGQPRKATEGYGQFIFLHRPGKDAFHRVPSRKFSLQRSAFSISVHGSYTGPKCKNLNKHGRNTTDTP
jgi:hypothetical protein